MTWQLPLPLPELECGEVHLWRALCAPLPLALNSDPKDTLTSDLEAFARLLTTSEIEHAGRFATTLLRRRYLQAHALLHTLLGVYAGAGSQRRELGYHPQGKPFLLIPQLQPALEFNLSHAGEMVVIALARGRSVGVDIEVVRPLDELEAMIGATCSAGEQEYLAKLPGDRRLAGFYRLWTRKEAWLKLCGAGLSGNLKATDVLGTPLAATLLDLSPADLVGGDYVGALALSADAGVPKVSVYVAHWQEQ